MINLIKHIPKIMGRKTRQTQKVSRAAVIWACRFILDREPGSKEAFEEYMSYSSVQALRAAFLSSEEFQLPALTLYRMMHLDTFSSSIRCFFLHIPKAFGTSFSFLLEKQYGHLFLPWLTNINPTFLNINILKAKFFGGHLSFEYFNGATVDNYLFLSAVRHPISRVISRYNYYLPNSSSESFLNLINEGTDPNLIEYSNNYQCRALCGEPSFEAALESINKNNFILGCYDYPQAFVDECANKLHWTSRELEHQNTAPEITYSKRFEENTKLISLLKKHNKEDMKLYEYIQKHKVVTTIKNDFDISQLYPPEQTNTDSSALPVTREDVISAYKIFLGRLPEDEEVIQHHLKLCKSSDDLLPVFMSSREFIDKLIF